MLGSGSFNLNSQTEQKVNLILHTDLFYMALEQLMFEYHDVSLRRPDTRSREDYFSVVQSQFSSGKSAFHARKETFGSVSLFPFLVSQGR